MGRINAMPGYIGGDYNMAGIKWIGSGPMNYKKGLPRASVTVVLNDIALNSNNINHCIYWQFIFSLL